MSETGPQSAVKNQRFENIKGDIEALEELLYFRDEETEADELLELIADIDSLAEHIGHYVSISEGMVFTIGTDTDQDDIEISHMLTPNRDAVSGIYCGMTVMTVSDPDFGDVTRVFYNLETGVHSYRDDMRNEITQTDHTYVTVSDSSLTIDGVLGAHNLDELKNDGFCLDIDQLLFDEEIDENSRFHRLASMFMLRGVENMTLDQTERSRRRLSYLNSTEYIGGLSLRASYVFYNLDDYPDSFSVSVNTTGYGIEVDGRYADRGMEVTIGGNVVDMDNNNFVMYIRGNSDEYGEVLVPYSPELYVEAYDEITFDGDDW